MSRERKKPTTKPVARRKAAPIPANRNVLPSGYTELLEDLKGRIQAAQVRAVLAVNSELVRLYWDIGRLIDLRQQEEGWGAAVIPRLSHELHNELPELKGFSERNIGRMIAFYRFYPQPGEFLPQPAAKLGEASFWSIPWFHHIILMEKVKDLAARCWYMEQTLTHGWSRNILALQIDSHAHARHGKAITNFAAMLPTPQSDLAQQTLKDPYIFDFLTLAEPFIERELETGLLSHVEKFLLELGKGFAFVGRQYPVTVGKEEYYIDLLFYHLHLRAFVVIDLKTKAFKPEYAGKLNFYCNVVNDRLRHSTDQPTIGLILCQSRDRLLAEYSLAGIDKPIGISTYQLTRYLPTSLQSALPSIEKLEEELTRLGDTNSEAGNKK